MTTEHIVEHADDFTEREPLPFRVGFVDPHEQTGSDDEVTPIFTQSHLPVKARDKKWRLWLEKDTFEGVAPFWVAAQPSDIPIPMFRNAEDDTYSNGFNNRSGARALAELQLAIYKAEAHLHHIEAMQEYRP